MDDSIDANLNGFVFGQTIAESVLGLGGLTREQLNAKYREVYEQIANASVTFAPSEAEIAMKFAKDLAGRELPAHIREKLATVRSQLQETQRQIIGV